MVTSEIFLGNVYLDNTPEGRAVMIQPLLVFLTHPNVIKHKVRISRQCMELRLHKWMFGLVHG